ncbi:hypothetical protein TNCV_4949411 [Trichonephila clavipes]|nr:hypothetical protein TNCV_4949411 [Trichonephila clavipes]
MRCKNNTTSLSVLLTTCVHAITGSPRTLPSTFVKENSDSCDQEGLSSHTHTSTSSHYFHESIGGTATYEGLLVNYPVSLLLPYTINAEF